MLIAPSSYGALSATSANTIKGNAPWFTGQSGAKKLGFVVDGISYSEANPVLGGTNTSKDKIISGVQKNFNGGLKLSDFVVTGLTANDFSPTTDYYDADGDLGYTLATDAFSMGSVTYDWYEGNTRLDKTNQTVMNQTLGCGSSLSLPLTLKITLPNVKVKSRYGNPKERGETNLVQMYKIGSESGICFAKPNSLWWQNAWGISGNSTNGGGYNSAQFDPVNGFKASLTTKFPTTGFPGAEFTLVTVGNPTDYTFNSNDSAVTVDTNGKVTLNSKPSGAVMIKAKYNATSQVHEYTFNPTTVWVRPTGAGTSNRGNYAWAIAQCGGNESNIPSGAQLTNSPQINYSGPVEFPSGAPAIPTNSYTRAVGGGVFSEWGLINSSNYPGSQWDSGHLYWTSDTHSTGVMFNIHPGNGRVVLGATGNSIFVACLE
ncbi:hypothetical protein RCS94_05225 [Orbaceae bacterium ac157xtp]